MGLNPTTPHAGSRRRQHSALGIAIQALRHQTVEALLSLDPNDHPEIANSVMRDFLLARASETRDLRMFHLLIEHDHRRGGHSQALIASTGVDFRQASSELLDLGLARPETDQNQALRNASRHGDLDFVVRALQMMCVTPASASNEAIRLAASQNHPDVVRVLARHRRTNVHAENNEAVFSAARHGHYEVLVALMQSPRFALAPNDLARAIQLAQPHAQVRGLLQDYQRDPQGTLGRVRGHE
jgi:hypothetical protein